MDRHYVQRSLRQHEQGAIYSSNLIELVQDCLCFRARYRPNLLELLIETRRQFEFYQNVYGRVDDHQAFNEMRDHLIVNNYLSDIEFAIGKKQKPPIKKRKRDDSPEQDARKRPRAGREPAAPVIGVPADVPAVAPVNAAEEYQKRLREALASYKGDATRNFKKTLLGGLDAEALVGETALGYDLVESSEQGSSPQASPQFPGASPAPSDPSDQSIPVGYAPAGQFHPNYRPDR